MSVTYQEYIQYPVYNTYNCRYGKVFFCWTATKRMHLLSNFFLLAACSGLYKRDHLATEPFWCNNTLPAAALSYPHFLSDFHQPPSRPGSYVRYQATLQ